MPVDIERAGVKRTVAVVVAYVECFAVAQNDICVAEEHFNISVGDIILDDVKSPGGVGAIVGGIAVDNFIVGDGFGRAIRVNVGYRVGEALKVEREPVK